MKEIVFKSAWSGLNEILDATNLTENEIKVLIASRNNEYADCDEEPSTWSFAVCDASGLTAKVYRGVVSSLIKKGYALVRGERNDEVFILTNAGKELFSVA